MSDIAAPVLLTPDWPAPANVRAVCSTRLGGCSTGAYASLNLGDHVGDRPEHICDNRQRYRQQAHMPAEPVWLKQVHSTAVLQLDKQTTAGITADASVTAVPGVVCTVMTADCLPVLLCDSCGTQVAAVHAGWRGLCHGIIEAALAQFARPGQVLAYLGPAIGPGAFEVGPEVRAAFMAHTGAAEAAFVAGQDGKYFADLYLLARQRLQQCGVQHIYGGSYCTYQQSGLFFSYRRDGSTGRMASSVWLT